MGKIKTTSKVPFNTAHEVMIRRVVAFANNPANSVITQSVAGFGNVITTLDAKLATITGLRASIAASITGYAAQKKAAKSALAAMSANIMKATYAYANSVNNNVLAQQMNVSQSTLFDMNEIDMLALVQGAIIAVTPLSVPLSDYGISALNMSDWQTLTANYNSILVTPQDAISTRETVNKSIQTLMRQCMVLLYFQADAAAMQFRFNQMDYYNNYRSSRKLDDPSLSTQLRMHVADQSGHGVAVGEVFIIGTDRSAELDENGYALVNHIPFGTHEVSLTTPIGTFTYGPFDFKKGKSRTMHVQITVNVASKSAASSVTKEEVITESDEK